MTFCETMHYPRQSVELRKPLEKIAAGHPQSKICEFLP